MQRPVKQGPVCDADRFNRFDGVENLARTNRQPRRAENAGEEKDIVYQLASATFRRLGRAGSCFGGCPSSSGAMAVPAGFIASSLRT